MSLPKTFTKLEYVKSTGTQFINTNIVLLSTTKVSVDYITDSWVNQGGIIGSNGGSSETYIGIYMSNGVNGRYTVRAGTVTQAWTESVATRHNVVFNDSGYFYIDNSRYTMGTYNGSNSVPLFLYSYNNDSGVVGSKSIYSVKIYLNGSELSYDLIPVQRKSDEEIGLYDLVNDIFYTNDGTGTFVAGPVIDENSINKIIYGNETLIDLTGDTVTAADVAEGKTFHLADGSQATGTSQGGSLEEIHYSLMCGCSNIDGSSSGYFSICYEITKPDGGIINVPNIPHLVNSPSKTSGGNIYYSYWKYNNNVNWSFGHESGEGKLPSATYPSVTWTITGTCPKGSSLRLIYQMYGNANWGAPQDVTANILGISTSATYNPSNSPGYTGNYIGAAAIVNDNIFSTYGHRQDNYGDHDWHSISIITAS